MNATAKTKDPIKDALEAINTPAKAASEPTAAQKQEAFNPVKAALAGSPNSGRKLSDGRIQVKGYLHNEWDVTIDRGVAVQELLRPDFWTHTAYRLKQQDLVTARSEDGSWIAFFVVTACDRLWAKLSLLEHYDLTDATSNLPPTQEEEYVISWTPSKKFSVARKDQKGNPPLKENLQTKIEAYAWLDQHLKTINS